MHYLIFFAPLYHCDQCKHQPLLLSHGWPSQSNIWSKALYVDAPLENSSWSRISSRLSISWRSCWTSPWIESTFSRLLPWKSSQAPRRIPSKWTMRLNMSSGVGPSWWHHTIICASYTKNSSCEFALQNIQKLSLFDSWI